jgi:hypothetical protein
MYLDGGSHAEGPHASVEPGEVVGIGRRLDACWGERPSFRHLITHLQSGVQQVWVRWMQQQQFVARGVVVGG